MIIFDNKSFQTRSDKPNDDWTGEALYIVDDNSNLAKKIIKFFPYYDFVRNADGELIDVILSEENAELEKLKKFKPTDDEIKTAEFELKTINLLREVEVL